MDLHGAIGWVFPGGDPTAPGPSGAGETEAAGAESPEVGNKSSGVSGMGVSHGGDGTESEPPARGHPASPCAPHRSTMRKVCEILLYPLPKHTGGEGRHRNAPDCPAAVPGPPKPHRGGCWVAAPPRQPGTGAATRCLVIILPAQRVLKTILESNPF